MEEEKTMTIPEVLEMTADMLGRISVPVDLIESIGHPILQAISNLTLCLQTIRNQPEEEKPEEMDG